MCVVDLLESVGLRGSVLSPSDAAVVSGPTGTLDAFRLERQLSTPTSSKEWELIAAQLPQQFGVHASFNALMFDGSLLSLIDTTDDSILLDIAYNSATDPNILSITLPGNNPFTFQVPAAKSDSPFHNIGIRLDASTLIVTLNCSLLDFATLANSVAPINLTNGVVNVYESQAIVSNGHRIE